MTTNPELTPTAAEFRELVTRALRLDSADRERLAAVIEAADAGDVSVSGSADADLPTGSDERAPPVVVWLQGIGNLRPVERLGLIDDALVGDDLSEAEFVTLTAARKQVLNDNVGVAARLAVQKATADHPVGVVVGVIGLGLASAGAVRGLLRVLF